MKHIILTLLIFFLSPTHIFADSGNGQQEITNYIRDRINNFEKEHCSTNSQGNKVCTYENGCYEYWNTSGIRYRHCDGDESMREINQYGLTDEAMSKGIRCEDFFPGTTLGNLNYCNCPDGKIWNNDIKLCTTDLDNPNTNGVSRGLTEEQIVGRIITFIFIVFILGYFIALPLYKKYFGVVEVNIGNNHRKGVSDWYQSLGSNSKNALSHFYETLNGVTVKKDILNMIDSYYEKNLSHIYSSEDKVYKDLFSLKDYL